MQYVNLGKSGVKVSRICLGCMSFGSEAWQIELEEARRVIKKAIDGGINFFDTANQYSNGRSEEILGECLKPFRDTSVIATKVGFPMGKGPNAVGLSRRHIMHEIKASLKRLQTDHVDLYQIHRWDYETPIEEALTALHDIVRQGMSLYIGASSMYAWQFLKSICISQRLGLETFSSMQGHYNLAYREEEREMIPLCQEIGAAYLAWSPLARGFLAGKYKRGEKPKTVRYLNDEYLKKRYFRSEDHDIAEAVEIVAKLKGVSSAQVALAWLLRKGVTSPILGVTKLQQIDEAIDALSVNLDEEDMRALETPYKPHPVIGMERLR
ncbi:MAG TPA: aldo/keto reductase [Candidatus Bathyarchaeia archaeon]|nr:aldo/keto reductase [Candidatus Bathyarchaeia archaeon]